MLQYSHFSPLSGRPDIPENYHIITIELSASSGDTRISLTQDKNSTEQEQRESADNWMMMLTTLKILVEQVA
jgi:hypothetical protein